MKAEHDIPDNSSTLDEFKASLSHFSYSPSPQPPAKVGVELRRSPRKSTPASTSPVKRQASERVSSSGNIEKTESSSPARSPKKQRRSYAPPETYAHLHELQDHLKENLDVIFCGINPGKKSAEIGHHFGNPSNHFWWCLHQSGFTDRKLPPEEDVYLPERFSLGLTNLVDRPTSEQNELSNKEQLDNVPTFLSKIARYRPRIVCFVGLGIAKVFESKLGLDPSSGSKTKSWGLRPYKMVHPAFSTFPETLFFAAPSTSGLVTQFQRPEKARIFAEMRTVVENLKVGSLSTSGMTAISPPPQLAQDPFLEPIVAHKSTNSFDPGLLKLEVDDTDATDTLEREE